MKLRMYLTVPALIVSSVILGFILFWVTYLATRGPLGVSTGYPLTYSYIHLPCAGPFGGCTYSYDPVLVSLDYLFWFAVSFVLVFAISVLWTLRSATS